MLFKFTKNFTSKIKQNITAENCFEHVIYKRFQWSSQFKLAEPSKTLNLLNLEMHV
jgi:hypothetical protein